MRRNDMISFRRTRRRSYRHPGEKYLLLGTIGVFVLLLALMCGTIVSRNHLNARRIDEREMLAASIQSDMNEVIRAYETIGRKSANLADDILPTMKQHMYAAYRMNRLLTESFGEEYAMFDPEQYESFAAIMARFDQLLAAGQSTDPAAERLNECMDSLKATLANRFTADGSLLPRTANASAQP